MIPVNRILIVVLLFTVICSVFSLSYVVFRQSDPVEVYTGFSAVADGFVNLTIVRIVNIEISPAEAILNFGSCTPGNISSFLRLDNNVNDAILDGPNCSNDNTSEQWLTLVNIGNLDVNVSVLSDCSSDEMIGGTNPQLNFTTESCPAGDIVWQEFSNSTYQLACANLTALGANEFNVSAGAIIPPDAIGGTGPCNQSVNVLTFLIEQT